MMGSSMGWKGKAGQVESVGWKGEKGGSCEEVVVFSSFFVVYSPFFVVSSHFFLFLLVCAGFPASATCDTRIQAKTS